MGRGGTWLSSTSHRSTRFTSTGGRLAAIGAEPPSRSGSSDPYVGAGGPSGGNTLRGLEAGFGGGASGRSGGGGFAVSRRMTVPQRYTRSTERVVDNGGASSIGGTATSSGIAARRAGRYRGSFVGNDASAAPRKLPLISSSGPGAKDEVGGVGRRATYPRPQQLREATGRGLVVREEGCGTCAVCTIQVSAYIWEWATTLRIRSITIFTPRHSDDADHTVMVVLGVSGPFKYRRRSCRSHPWFSSNPNCYSRSPRIYRSKTPWRSQQPSAFVLGKTLARAALTG